MGKYAVLAAKVAVQLNDTHPSLAVTELMRILAIFTNIRWDDAWKITVNTLSTPTIRCFRKRLRLAGRAVPAAVAAYLEIIYRINVAHLALADARCPGDVDFPRLGLADRREVRPEGYGWGNWRS